MRYRFIGKYTNGHTGINAWGLDFEGREPLEVPAHLVDKFARHIEFERIDDGVRETETETPTEAPKVIKRRGRPKKVAQ